jgi:hypothetical protein
MDEWIAIYSEIKDLAFLKRVDSEKTPNARGWWRELDSIFSCVKSYVSLWIFTEPNK